MSKYYVSTKPLDSGVHEVHKSGCFYVPAADQCLYLGEFNNCAAAVLKAKEIYLTAGVCCHCSIECHIA